MEFWTNNFISIVQFYQPMNPVNKLKSQTGAKPDWLGGPVACSTPQVLGSTPDGSKF